MLLVLVFHTGVDAVGQALAPVGWGIVPIVLTHAVPMAFDIVAWRVLFVATAPPLSTLIKARWIGEAANNLLPVAQLGGDLVRIRLVTLAGTKTVDATASVLADLTLGAFAQILFGVSGALLLAAWHGAQSIMPILGGFLLFGSGIGVFYWFQRGRPFHFVWRVLGSLSLKPGWVAKLGRAEPFHDALDAIYANRAGVRRSCFLHLVGWVAGSVEIYVSLQFLGHPGTWTEAFILESLAQAGRSAAFPVPGGLGVQEASFLAVGTMLGLAPSTCLALALLRRGRDVILGVPALAAYWLIETRRSAVGDKKR